MGHPNHIKANGMNNTQAVEAIDYEESLRELWEQHLGFVPEYPVNWEQVQTLVEGMDYIMPNLDYLSETGLLIAPGPEAWGPDDVCHLIGAAETLRLWREAPDSVHWPKFSRFQRGRIVSQHEGTFDGLADNMKKFTFRHLLIMLATAKTKEDFDRCYASLETKLIAENLD